MGPLCVQLNAGEVKPSLVTRNDWYSVFESRVAFWGGIYDFLQLPFWCTVSGIHRRIGQESRGNPSPPPPLYTLIISFHDRSSDRGLYFVVCVCKWFRLDLLFCNYQIANCLQICIFKNRINTNLRELALSLVF